jgi:DNA-directed RNA polymerase subunit E"
MRRREREMPIRKKQATVCRQCHRVVDGESCVVCGSTNLSVDWAGYLVIIDPAHSDIAKKMNIDLPGRYALKVR